MKIAEKTQGKRKEEKNEGKNKRKNWTRKKMKNQNMGDERNKKKKGRLTPFVVILVRR